MKEDGSVSGILLQVKKHQKKCPSFYVDPKLSIWNKTSRGINYFFVEFSVSFLNPKEITAQEGISHLHQNYIKDH